MSRKKGCQMLRYADGANTRTATSVRDGKCLVQVEMTYIRSYSTRVSEPYLCIHVSSVHIDLTACLMNQPSHLFYPGLKYPMCGGIGNHEGRQIIFVLFHLTTQIFHIHITFCITGNS